MFRRRIEGSVEPERERERKRHVNVNFVRDLLRVWKFFLSLFSVGEKVSFSSSLKSCMDIEVLKWHVLLVLYLCFFPLQLPTRFSCQLDQKYQKYKWCLPFTLGFLKILTMVGSLTLLNLDFPPFFLSLSLSLSISLPSVSWSWDSVNLIKVPLTTSYCFLTSYRSKVWMIIGKKRFTWILRVFCENSLILHDESDGSL